MVIISVISSIVVFNAVYPAIVQSSDAMVDMQSRLDDRLKSQVQVIHAIGELNSSSAWQDMNGDGDFDVVIWVKNVGSKRVSAIERTDVFFGPEGNFTRIAHQNTAGGSYPYWTYKIENDTNWNPTATLEIEIHFSTTLSPGQYLIKVVAPNGVESVLIFSI